jgi:DGQHR domain-containing protein
MYFKAISSSIKLSSRNELINFLGVPHKDAGDNCLNTAGTMKEPFKGSILPDSHSHLGENFKVVSFYISPGALLERAYVLRKEGWKDSDWLYQRMIAPKKIEVIRSFLKNKGRVFLNNIIVTLPAGTKVVDDNGDTMDSSNISSTTPATIELPKEPNTVGLIDGQHRVFSYHEGGKFEGTIAPLRSKLNLLVTGIMYPAKMSEADRLKFEAEIFLEINSNQASASSDLKQAITSILNPFDPAAIAKRVLVRLNRSGALSNMFVSYFYDTERLKTTSVVSYGIRHIVSIGPNSPLFQRWEHPDKLNLLDKSDLDLLQEWIDFCFSSLNVWFLGIKKNFSAGRWDYKKSTENRVLNTTNVIGFLNLYRLVITNDVNHKSDRYDLDMNGIDNFDFSKYKSSQYGAMGRDLYARLYGNTKVQ